MSRYIPKREKIYMTESIRRRLASIPVLLELNHYTKTYLKRELSVNSEYLSEYISSKRILELWRYRIIADVFAWDLSHDVNYVVSEGLYPKREIRRRFERLGYYDERTILLHLTHYSGKDRNYLYTQNPSKHIMKCVILKFIDRLERTANLPNGLELEE